jgi:hypothetical protein
MAGIVGCAKSRAKISPHATTAGAIPAFEGTSFAHAVCSLQLDSVRKIAPDARVKSKHLAGRFCTPYGACRVLPLMALAGIAGKVAIWPLLLE